MSLLSKWPRHNLRNANFINLALSATYDQSSATYKLLSPYLPDNQPYVSAATYSRGKFRYGLIQTAWLVESEEGQSIYLRVNYDGTGNIPAAPVPPELKREDELIALLREADDRVYITGEAEIRFDVDAHPNAESVFPLPTTLGADIGPDFPIDEIWGISGIKMTDTEPKLWDYHFSMERIPEMGIKLSLTFAYSDHLLEPEVAQGAFARARTAAQRLVLSTGR